MNEELILYLRKKVDVKVNFETLLEKPKHESHGDIALPCFLIAKELKKNPVEVAKSIEESIGKDTPAFISKVQAMGPFLNIYLNSEQEIKSIFEMFKKEVPTYKTEKKQKILIEYPSPNTNKSLHLGHVRNMLIGTSLGYILESAENKVVRVNLNNDRGIAICKAMLSYQLFNKGETPQSLSLKPDKFVEHYYVLFGEKVKKNHKLEEQAQDMLVKWEQGDKEVRALWKKILEYVYEGYEETYSIFNLKFDKEYYESDIFDQGKELVQKAIKEKIKGFQVDPENGAAFVDLEEEGYGKKYLLRGDGTTVYMTQDLYLNSVKINEFGADKYIFIVGEEQKYHFEVLFELFDRMKLANKEDNFHFAYGYVYDENGKKFSSRKGNVVRADELYVDIVALAKQNLNERESSKDLPDKEKERRSKIIGFGALAFTFLKANPISQINFSLKQSLAFEGETGPYVQYTYARIQSLFRKADYKMSTNINYNTFEDEREIKLAKLLKEYPLVLEEATKKYKISSICHYLIKVCQTFNEFYQNVPILKEEDKEKIAARLLLLTYVSQVIKHGLNLLDIEVLDEM